MPIEIQANLKVQLKEQRLRNLSAQWYEQEMNRVAYEANGRAQQATEAMNLQKEIEASYQVISEMN